LSHQSDRLTTQRITHPITFELIDESGATAPTEVELEYRPADPYAVSLVFDAHSTRGEPVRWEVGRDLLENGLFEPAGSGDVELWPCLDTACHAVLMIELCGADGGTVVMQAQARELRGFLNATYALVPEGSETQLLDLDGLITALLGPEETSA
jgi:hypothetical protein